VGEATGLLLGLLAAGVWGTQDVLVAFAGRRVGGIVSAIGIVGTSMVIVFAIGIVTGTGPPSDPRIVLIAIAQGAISSVGFTAFYTALRLGPISVVSPTVAVYGGLSSLLAVVILGERPGPVQVAGAVAATLGIAFVGLTVAAGSSRPKLTGPGVPFALVALVAWSTSTIVLAVAIQGSNWLSVVEVARPANLTFLVVALLVVRWRGGRREDLPPLTAEPEPVIDVEAGAAVAERGMAGRLSTRLSAHPYRILLVGGVFETIGYAAFTYGLQVAPAWLVALASSLGPMVTVAAGVLLLGERPKLVQWAGIALVFSGIALVAVG
jgi:drug/metabolite transporter (DMT)-like permease